MLCPLVIKSDEKYLQIRDKIPFVREVMISFFGVKLSIFLYKGGRVSRINQATNEKIIKHSENSLAYLS